MTTAIITIPLETPLKRDGGAADMTELKLRRPVSGDLRGISIAKLGQLDYDELRRLLPRISVETLLDIEVDRIDPADMLEISGEVADFLFTKRRKAEFQAT